MLDNEELLRRFELEHMERNSISTQRRGETFVTLRRLISLHGDGWLLTDITASDLMEWQGAELQRGLTPNSVRKVESMVRAFTNWAYIAGLIDWERTAQLKSVCGVRGAGAQIRPRPYTKREIESLREALDRKYPLAPVKGTGSRALSGYFKGRSPFQTAAVRHGRRLQLEAQISLALEEGLRCTEIYHLTLAELHPGNAAVVVQTAKTKPGERREREVPWTEHSRNCVSDWLAFRHLMAPDHDRPWLALIAVSNPAGPQTFQAFARFLEDRLGREFHWHRLRHTYATERLRAGLPLEQLQICLGHARLEQTLAYAKIVSGDVSKEAWRTETAFARAIGVAA